MSRYQALSKIPSPQWTQKPHCNMGIYTWWYGYGSIPINAIFRGMNIHLPAILMWTTGVQGFDTLPYFNMEGHMHIWSCMFFFGAWTKYIYIQVDIFLRIPSIYMTQQQIGRCLEITLWIRGDALCPSLPTAGALQKEACKPNERCSSLVLLLHMATTCGHIIFHRCRTCRLQSRRMFFRLIKWT